MKPLARALSAFIKYVLIGLGIYVFVLGVYTLGMFFINGKTLGDKSELYSAVKMALWLTFWIAACAGPILHYRVIQWRPWNNKKSAAESATT